MIVSYVQNILSLFDRRNTSVPLRRGYRGATSTIISTRAMSRVRGSFSRHTADRLTTKLSSRCIFYRRFGGIACYIRRRVTTSRVENIGLWGTCVSVDAPRTYGCSLAPPFYYCTLLLAISTCRVIYIYKQLLWFVDYVYIYILFVWNTIYSLFIHLYIRNYTQRTVCNTNGRLTIRYIYSSELVAKQS